MRLKFNEELFNKVGNDTLEENGATFDTIGRQKIATINLINLSKQQISKLRHHLSGIHNTLDCDVSLQIRYIDYHLEILENPFVKLKNLEQAELAAIGYVSMSKKYRLYIENNANKKSYAYRVSKIKYDNNEIDITLVFEKRGERLEYVSEIKSKDVRGRNIKEVFSRLGFAIETDEKRTKYLLEKKRYEDIYEKIGEQFSLNGISRTDIACLDEYGHPNVKKYIKSKYLKSKDIKVVIDVEDESDKIRYRDNNRDSDISLGNRFWKKHSKIFKISFEESMNASMKQFIPILKENLEEKSSKEMVEVPIDPEIIYFDLKRHIHLSSHPDFLKEYDYMDSIEDSLIVSDVNKKLIHNLINNSEKNEFRDIIRNKSGGMLIILAGSAGVGKTLTAEVFSEIKRKPLYSIQSSQLGVEPKEIEEKLKLCFERSIRWNAILLIDEADVYVHKRTNDLKQNAVVGTFLRILEYYPTITFMTTNRSDIIDDAIISRCIAVMPYEKPSSADQHKIWKVLLSQQKIEISVEELDSIVKDTSLTGRDIKNLIKLLKISSNAEMITLEKVRQLIQFIPTTDGSLLKASELKENDQLQ